MAAGCFIPEPGHVPPYTMKRNLPAFVLILLAAFIVRSQAGPSGVELLEETDLFINGQDGIRQFRIPVLLTTQRGTLLAVCEARVEKDGDAPNNIDIVMKRSTDGGRIWSPLRTLMNNGNGAAGDALGLVDRQTGTIWIFAVWFPEGVGSINAQPGLGGDTATYWAVKSDDDGVTWSEPIDLTPMFKRPDWRSGSVGPGNGIQMRNGRLIVPRYYLAGPANQPMRPTAFVSYSDDHGKTWHIGGMTTPRELTNECQVVEREDGSLLLNMRNVINGRGNFRKLARSHDGGETWTKMTEDSGLIEPDRGCQASLLTYTTKAQHGRSRLLFSNPASLRRNNFSIRLSYDEGETWTEVRQLYGGPAAYSSLAILPDMTIACLYERGDRNLYEKITFARFNLEWLTRGRDSLKSVKPAAR
jgi:sialidase-1